MPNDRYPRIFDCRFDYCAARRPECKVCDEIFADQYGRQNDEHVRDYHAERAAGQGGLKP